MSSGSSKVYYNAKDVELLGSPVVLPCGRVVPNRFAKVAMYENLSPFWGGIPNKLHNSLYSLWAKGGWGMIMTGNVQVSPSHLSLGRDITIPEGKWTNTQLSSFRKLAKAMHNSESSNPPLAIMQLNHSGRQSPRILGGRIVTSPFSCSSHRLAAFPAGLFSVVATRLMYQTPKTLSTAEADEIVREFSRAAQLAFKTGFDGIQIHAAHGYLLCSFLSGNLNDRTDVFRDRLLIVKRIIRSIRSFVSPQFIVGIKLNAADYAYGGLTEEQALEDCKQIAVVGVDFIEISGGTYENPAFATSPRQVLFASYSHKVVAAISSLRLEKSPLVLLTGGLRTPSQFTKVLQNDAHILGFARLAVAYPDLPNRILSSDPKDGVCQFEPISEPELYQPQWFPRFANCGINTVWHCCQLKRLAEGKKVDMGIGAISACLNFSLGGPYDSTFWAKRCLIMLIALYVFFKIDEYSRFLYFSYIEVITRSDSSCQFDGY